MTDHLEPYRQMARSLRFVPSQGPVEPAYRRLTKLSKLEASTPPISPGWAAPDAVTAPTPAVDPSRRAEELIRAAVAKPTVLPVTYHLLENIGDRISKLSPSKPPQPQPWEPKIPQPGSAGWVPSSPAPEPPRMAEPAAEPAAAAEQLVAAETKANEASAPKPVATPAQSTPDRASASSNSKTTKTRSKSRRGRSSRKS